MSNLGDLEKKLYKQIEEKDLNKRDILEKPSHTKEINEELEKRKAFGLPEEKIIREKPSLKRKIKSFAFIFVIIVIFVASLVFYYTRNSFDPSLVSFKIVGPKSFVSGNSLNYKIYYENKGRVALKNSIITLEWPENSLLKDGVRKVTRDISLIAPNERVIIDFDGIIFGELNKGVELNAVLNYQPENSSSQLTIKTDFLSKIDSTTIALDLVAPRLAISQREFEMTVNYLNSSNTEFDKMLLKIDYPINFIFISSTPNPTSSNNQWFFDKLAAKKNGSIKIIGKLTSNLHINQFRASIGSQKISNFITYAEKFTSIDVTGSALTVSGSINNSHQYIANSGETFQFKINYKNTSLIPVANVVITARIDGLAVDFQGLDVRSGDYNSQTNMITWNSSGVDNLALLNPQAEGEVSFIIRIKNPLPIFKFSDKDFKINVISKIDSQSVPELLRGIPIGMEENFELKIKTEMFAKLSSFFKDNLFGNTGPIPPKVGSKTTYTIILNLTNTSNDLEGVKVETFLPSYVEWLNKFSPINTDLGFDPVTGKLTINIPKVLAGVGITSGVLQIAFQVAITPAINQINQSPNLIRDTTITAKDSYTLSELQSSISNVTTLATDMINNQNQGVVVQ